MSEENNPITQELEIHSQGSEVQLRAHMLPNHINILPLAQRPVFPGIAIPMTFSGNDKVKALKKAMDENEGYIGLVLAQDYHEEDYTESQLYEVGTIYQIMRMNPIAPGVVQVLGRGISRLKRKRSLP